MGIRWLDHGGACSAEQVIQRTAARTIGHLFPTNNTGHSWRRGSYFFIELDVFRDLTRCLNLIVE